MSLDVQLVRSKFPALESGCIFADNAGGSQARPRNVSDLGPLTLPTGTQIRRGRCARLPPEHQCPARRVLFHWAARNGPRRQWRRGGRYTV